MKDIFDLLDAAYKNVYHTKGLIAAYILIAGVFVTIRFNPCGSSVNFLVFILIVASIQSSWLLLRRIPSFSLNEIGILFSPYGDEDVRKDIERLRSELACRIKSNPHCKKFVFKTLPPNRVVMDVNTALTVRQRSKCMLFIWGRYEKGRLNNKELRGFPLGQLNFTYAYLTEMNERAVTKDIGIGISDRKWMFASENELLEREFVHSNLYAVVRYIIGTCLLYMGNAQYGKEILVDMITSPEQHTWTGGAKRTVKIFLDNVRAKISRCDALIAYDLYVRNIFVNGRLKSDSAILDRILKFAEASIQNKPNADAYTIKSIAHFLLDDLHKAKKTLAHLKKREPLNPSADYSLGFLNAYDGNLEKAERHYSKAFKKTANVNGDYIFHISEFVEAILEAEPNKINLHYALGLIHKELIDPQSAIVHFDRFISEAQTDGSLLPFVEKARSYKASLAKRIEAELDKPSIN